jgi:two-component system, response regulator PdtaR
MSAPVRKLKVLIVEDDSLVADLIQSQLEAIGCVVLAKASDGFQAVEKAQLLDPDVVLMDIEMPGQDGLEATRCIQQLKPRPVVLLTAHENPELLARAGDAGVGGYIVKPTSLQELDRTIAIAVARFADLVELRRLNEELRMALASVKRLSGLLPICASCKKIRDDKGYWQSVEAYLIERTDAQFSHGCCPECTKKLYPDYIPRT